MKKIYDQLKQEKSFKKSVGEYIAVLDDDIWCDKDKLKKQVKFMEKIKIIDYVEQILF